MPMPVSDVFPVKYVDGTQVCLFEGNTLEKFSALKLDVLGLRTLDVINDYAVSKNPDMNIYDVYDLIEDKLEDEDYFNDICDLKTEAIFQIESNLFKGIIKDMQPRNIEDITALVAIARPGPLAAGMHTMYNNRKNGLEEWDEPLPFTMEFVETTYGCIIYQEQIMQIAQKVAKFNGNQTDSMFRKAVA